MKKILRETLNSYRIKKSLIEKCDLKREDHTDDVFDNELVYLVRLLPQSLLYNVFNFCINSSVLFPIFRWEKGLKFSILVFFSTKNRRKFKKVNK